LIGGGGDIDLWLALVVIESDRARGRGESKGPAGERQRVLGDLVRWQLAEVSGSVRRRRIAARSSRVLRRPRGGGLLLFGWTRRVLRARVGRDDEPEQCERKTCI
jgi:hypothetical protein